MPATRPPRLRPILHLQHNRHWLLASHHMECHAVHTSGVREPPERRCGGDDGIACPVVAISARFRIGSVSMCCSSLGGGPACRLRPQVWDHLVVAMMPTVARRCASQATLRRRRPRRARRTRSCLRAATDRGNGVEETRDRIAARRPTTQQGMRPRPIPQRPEGDAA